MNEFYLPYTGIFKNIYPTANLFQIAITKTNNSHFRNSKFNPITFFVFYTPLNNFITGILYTLITY